VGPVSIQPCPCFCLALRLHLMKFGRMLLSFQPIDDIQWRLRWKTYDPPKVLTIYSAVREEAVETNPGVARGRACIAIANRVAAGESFDES
jgi:hypothetical protein